MNSAHAPKLDGGAPQPQARQLGSKVKFRNIMKFLPICIRSDSLFAFTCTHYNIQLQARIDD